MSGDQLGRGKEDIQTYDKWSKIRFGKLGEVYNYEEENVRREDPHEEVWKTWKRQI